MPETAIKEKVGPAIGRISSGVYIVTVGGDSPDGMLTTWLSQSGFEPPSIVFSVNKTRDFLKRLAKGQKFAVNVLSKNNMDVFKAFARPHNEGKFEGLALVSDLDVPVFSGCVAYMVGVVGDTMDSGDHIVVSGEIVDGGTLNLQDEPMTHLRKDGFQY